MLTLTKLTTSSGKESISDIEGLDKASSLPCLMEKYNFDGVFDWQEHID